MSPAPKRCKVNLPKDWIVVNSTSFPDRVYYFNVRTGKSSWKEPTEESNKPKTDNTSQKRKLSVENEEDDVHPGKLRSPDSTGTAKQSERRLLRAKRPSEPRKARETPQMKAMRQKILEKKQSKNAQQNEKSRTRGAVSEIGSEKASLASGKSSRSEKSSPQKRYSKSGTGDDAAKLVDKVLGTRSISSSSQETEESASQASSSTSYKKSPASALLNIVKSTKTRVGQSAQKNDSSKAGSSSEKRTLKKNLAHKRLDSLKKNLSTERKKIEPTINAKVARRMLSQNNEPEKRGSSPDPNEKKLKRAQSPTEESPSISRNVESRFKTLTARLTADSASPSVRINEDNRQSDKTAVKGSKVFKTSKKVGGKKGAKGASTANAKDVGVREEPHASRDRVLAENQCRDSFWEEMEWEPIEEEKVVVEIQEVRMQLSTDQGTQSKLPDYTINGLELSQVSQNTDKRILYIVVDTNVYLSNLKTVTELLEDSGKINGHYRPVVVVPWTVLQELDYIKDNKSRTKSAHLQMSAKYAVDFLFRYFSSKHPRLKGQTAEDAALNKVKFQIESPDDEILQSCLQIRKLGYTVVLLSNDKNLCNKAIIHDISTYGRHESIQEMLSQSRNESEYRPTGESLRNIENQAETVDSKEAEISDDIFCEAKAIIKHFLSTIVSKEMENLYGENWKKYTIVQPPWSVTDVLKCTSKHWIAAISDVFVKQAEPLVAKLSKMFLDSPKYGRSLRHVSEVLDACHDFVQMIKSKNYQELSEKTRHDTQELIHTCKEKLKELEGNRSQAFIEHENNNLNDEQRANNAFRYFEHIWTFTNNFCGLAADLMGIPHSITYKNFEPALPVETINRIQPELVFNLNQLIHALRTVLNDDEYLNAEHPALIALYQILVHYFHNSGELNDSRSLDIVDLLCCIRVKKDFLQTGLIQLQELCCQFCRIAEFRSTTINVLN